MEEFLDFNKCVSTWNKNWEDICTKLSNIPIYDPLPKFEDLIHDELFCKIISQIVDMPETITVYSTNIGCVFKGIHEEDRSKVSPSRFIPKAEFIKTPNRMNGIDRLYNYFSIDYNGCCGDDLIYTSAHELRLNPSDSFWGCNFKFREGEPLKFANLMTECKLPKDNDGCFKFLKSKSTHGKKYGKLDRNELEKWIVQILFGIWENSDMFAPIDKKSSEYLLSKYRPFHLLCDLLQRRNFDGVIYRSTVYKKGACLAIFDIDNAVCICESIRRYDAGKYSFRKK